MRAERCVPGHDVERERCTAGHERDRGRIVEVEHVVLVLVVGLERDVPLIVELVIIGQPVPLEIVVAPGAVVDAVGDHVDAVIAAVGDVADDRAEGGLRTRIFQHGAVREQRIRDRIGDLGADMPRHCFGADRECRPGSSSSCSARAGVNAGVRIVVERVGHRMRIHVIVRRELRLDVRDRDVAAEPQQKAVGQMGMKTSPYAIGMS